MTRRLIDSYVLGRPTEAGRATDDRLDRLTDREREVLVAVDQG